MRGKNNSIVMKVTSTFFKYVLFAVLDVSLKIDNQYLANMWVQKSSVLGTS